MTAVNADAELDGTRRRMDPVLVGLWISLVLVALIWVAPFVFMVFTSLKTNEAVMTTGAFTPPPAYAWENYTEAWGRGRFDVTFFNSAIIASSRCRSGWRFPPWAPMRWRACRSPGAR